MSNSLKTISATSLKLYQDCPYCWKLKYVYKLLQEDSDALIIGKAFHKVVELYHKGFAKDAIIDNIKKDVVLDQQNENQINMFSLIKEMADKYFSKPLDMPTVELEKQFKLFLKNIGISVPLFGYIDRIAENNTLVEYKTTSKDYTTKETNGIQTDVYSYYYWKKYKQIPKVIYYVINKKKLNKPSYEPQILTVQRTEEDMGKFEDICKEFYQNVKDEKFNPSSEKHWSPFNNICPTSIN